ncbi:MAG: DUF2059 domain-containing protein [Verrucomicrobia bacterium]|nr:DUF2059 domain-containing protein [Verrucomicrobiota bacterium]
MKKALLTLLLAISPLFTFAQTAAVRPDIDELFTVMRLEKTMQSTMEQVRKMVPQMTANMIGKMSENDPAAMQKAKASQEKLFALIYDEMSWEKLKPLMAAVYAESLTPDEVRGVTEFYKTSAGQAFLNKQPVIVQKSIAMQQKMMMDLMPKIQAVIKSEFDSAKAAPQPTP